MLFPSHPVARESIVRYVDALKSVCVRVADGRFAEPLSRLVEFLVGVIPAVLGVKAG